MTTQWPTSADEVEQLLLNARLRDEMEPYRDESIEWLDAGRVTTSFENDYLASMLDWERSPVLPISEWFDPPLRLPRPDSLEEQRLKDLLWQAIRRLDEKRIALAYTDHLSDRELYCLLYRDILTAEEKRLMRRRGYLYWYCVDADEDEDTWLRFYASDAERECWAEDTGGILPPREIPPHPRHMPVCGI